MGRNERSLRALGRHVAGEQDTSPEATLDQERGLAAFLAEAAKPAQKAPSRAPRLGLVGALAAAFALAAWLFFGFTPRDTLHFQIGNLEQGSVGAWLAAPSGASLPLHFSDGSEGILAPESRARVVALSPEGAEIALERGSLSLSVIHHDTTRWRVRGGPFQVAVVGTRFDTRWEPDTEELELTLHEGAVRLSGPVVGERAVATGEHLRVSVARGTLEVRGLLPAAPPAPPAVAAPPETALLAPPPAATLPVATTGARPAPPPPSIPGPGPGPSPSPSAAPGGLPLWLTLYRGAQYAEALRAAESEGFDALCDSASAKDLSALADVARLGGSAARTGQALTALRARFAGTPEAAAAAFLLGRAAQDRYRDPAGAAQWFQRYLNEAPTGELAAEARGRLVEVTDAMGDQAGARTAAERYLALYPGGAHAAFARAVLARGAGAPP